MSSYYKALDSIARTRYLEKLGLLGFEEKDDSYFYRDKFEDHMAKWPPVEFSHMFCNFIERPGVYTRQQLLQWKSLDGYNYFKSGLVRKIRVWEVGSNFRLLMATVNPNQSSHEKKHLAWVAVKSSGDIEHVIVRVWLGKFGTLH
jgi:hypothetical protein